MDNIYKLYSFKKLKPGQKNFMSLEELNEICEKCNIYDENFITRDMQWSFNLSMMT